MAKVPQDRARSQYSAGRVDDPSIPEVVAGARAVEGGKGGVRKVSKRTSAKNAGPDNAGTATNRVDILAGAEAQERYGARFRTDIGMPLAPNAPEAAFTQANGRVIRSAVRRDRVNFWQGHYEGGGTWG